MPAEEQQTTFRDYTGEMRAYVKALVKGQRGEHSHTRLANEIVDYLRDHDPELLRGWLEAQAADLIRQYVGHVARSERGHQRAVSGRKRFGDAVERHASGDPTALTDWLSQQYLINESNSRLPLGKMNREQLEFAAGDYQRRADTNAFEAKFLLALARKVGSDTVEEHFNEETICKMRNSLNAIFHAA